MKRTSAAEVSQTKQWEELFRLLQAGIISGQFHPRERLVEDEIIAVHGATRHAVRKALDELERLGLVIRQPNRGVQVRDYSLIEIAELYEIRECLELRAASRFSEAADSRLIEDLTAIADRHRAASRAANFTEVFTLNNEFHQAIYRAAGNTLLAEAIVHYTFATHPIRTRAFPNEELRELAIAEHYEMIDAIAAGDRDRLGATIRTHIGRPRDFYLKTSFVR